MPKIVITQYSECGGSIGGKDGSLKLYICDGLKYRAEMVAESSDGKTDLTLVSIYLTTIEFEALKREIKEIDEKIEYRNELLGKKYHE